MRISNIDTIDSLLEEIKIKIFREALTQEYIPQNDNLGGNGELELFRYLTQKK